MRCEEYDKPRSNRKEVYIDKERRAPGQPNEWSWSAPLLFALLRPRPVTPAPPPVSRRSTRRRRAHRRGESRTVCRSKCCVVPKSACTGRLARWTSRSGSKSASHTLRMTCAVEEKRDQCREGDERQSTESRCNRRSFRYLCHSQGTESSSSQATLAKPSPPRTPRRAASGLPCRTGAQASGARRWCRRGRRTRWRKTEAGRKHCVPHASRDDRRRRTSSPFEMREWSAPFWPVQARL